MSALSVILLSSCALKVPPVPEAPVSARPWLDQVDWDTAGREAAEVLSAYIQVDTTNPPGNETLGAEYLGALLEKEGIPYEIVEPVPGRGSLIARLDSASDQEAPLCLMSHIDVVTADAENWLTDPLSGEIRDGYIWGRGALDMKGMGVVELLSMVWLKRLDVTLRRDVILLAVADEEIDNAGALHVVKMWNELGCSHLINEGGIGLEDMLFEGQTVFPISVGEKGALWIKMIARGEPGHGSTPQPDEAPGKLIAAARALEARKIDVHIHDSLYELLAAVGEDKGGAAGFVMQRPGLVKRLVKPTLMSNPLTRAGIIDTVHLTGLSGYNEPNVVPSEVFALLDCRTLPDTRPEDHLAYIQEIVGPDIELEVISSMQGNTSPWQGDPVYEAIARQVRGHGFVPGPVVSVGFTDSIYMRPLGVRAYGFMPWVMTAEDMEGFHGNNERISIVNMRRGLEMMLGTVLEVSAQQP